MLGWSRLEIFVDIGQNQRIWYFRGWTEKLGSQGVSLPGFGIGMINEDFHISGIREVEEGSDVFDGSRSEML